MKKAGLSKSIFSFLLMVPLMWGTTVLALELRVPSSDYSSIQAAIDVAVPGVDVVVVADGTYSGNLLVEKAITIKSQNGREKTTIDCANESRGITFIGPDASGAVLSGFTITRGNGQGLGQWPGFGGAILFVDSASATISDCTISGNTENIFAGVISCIQSSPVIKHCIIENNIASYGGGGLLCYQSSSPTLIGCTITNNQAYMGGGVYLDTDARPAFVSCLIADNSATQAGGAFYMTNSCSAHLTYCTVSGNTVSESGPYGGAGIFSYYECSTSITNSILWGNEATHGPEIYLYYSSIAINHSDVSRGEKDSNIYIDPTEDPTAAPPSEVKWGEGNIDQDPLFVAEGDYHLSQDSPCIDAGVPLDDTAEFDIDGDPRVVGNAPDMGADEFVPEEEEVIQVEIDIKPGCHHKKINLKSWGVLAVAVKATKDFDARSIDPKTVVFEGAAPIGYIRHDIDRDRDKDMVFFFKIKKLNLDEDSTEATLSGKTKEGKPFEGTDTLSIEKPKRKAAGWHFGRR